MYLKQRLKFAHIPKVVPTSFGTLSPNVVTIYLNLIIGLVTGIYYIVKQKKYTYVIHDTPYDKHDKR